MIPAQLRRFPLSTPTRSWFAQGNQGNCKSQRWHLHDRNSTDPKILYLETPKAEISARMPTASVFSLFPQKTPECKKTVRIPKNSRNQRPPACPANVLKLPRLPWGETHVDWKTKLRPSSVQGSTKRFLLQQPLRGTTKPWHSSPT